MDADRSPAARRESAARAGRGEDPVRSGDILHVTRAASVQFAVPILFRVIRVHDWPTYEGWVWLDGYQLNSQGDAVERRSIFVRVSGLRLAQRVPDPRARGVRRARRPGAVDPAPPTVAGDERALG